MADEKKTKERKTNICVFLVGEGDVLTVIKDDFAASTDAKKWLIGNAEEGKKYRYGSVNKGNPLQVKDEVKKKIM